MLVDLSPKYSWLERTHSLDIELFYLFATSTFSFKIVGCYSSSALFNSYKLRQTNRSYQPFQTNAFTRWSNEKIVKIYLLSLSCVIFSAVYRWRLLLVWTSCTLSVWYAISVLNILFFGLNQDLELKRISKKFELEFWNEWVDHDTREFFQYWQEKIFPPIFNSSYPSIEPIHLYRLLWADPFRAA